MSSPAPVQRHQPAIGRDLWIGYALAATGAILFSTKSIIIKLVYAEGVDSETLLALRMILSVPIYLAIGFHSLRHSMSHALERTIRRLILRAAAIGALGYWLSSYLDFRGLEYISAQFERLILFTYPFFVILFGATFFAQPVKMKALLAFAVAYGGLALLFMRDLAAIGAGAAYGAGFVLAAATSFALYQLLARNVIVEMGPRLFTCVAMSAAGAVAILQFFATHDAGAILVSPYVLAMGVALAIGGTVLPSFFMNAALQRVSAQVNSTIGTLSPVVTIFLAVIVLGEPLTWLDMVAAALVIAGVGAATLADRR
jgi:drug/metabolite transporter (DMT)-like permease